MTMGFKDENERDPETPEEWQQAVDVARFWLLYHSAKQYGLIEGGTVVVVDRCQEILDRGRQLGYVPASIETLVQRYVGAYGVE